VKQRGYERQERMERKKICEEKYLGWKLYGTEE